MIVNTSSPYPFFSKGQQLKSTSLTGIVNYAEQESEDTRIYLEGRGVFYGLTLDWQETSNTLRLLPGTAVTSDGLLFVLDDALTFSRAKTEEQLPLSGQQVNIRRLVTGNTEGEPLATVLAEKDYIVVLVSTRKDSPQSSCLYGYNSNEITREVQAEAVLIAKTELDKFDRQKWFPQITPVLEGDGPAVHRFGYQNENAGITFDSFINWSTVADGFKRVCTEAEAGIGEAYRKLYALVQPLLLPDNTDNPFDGLAASLAAVRQQLDNNDKWLPWWYDYCKELVSAYEEFANSDFFNTVLVSFPDKKAFPGYIALGPANTDSPADGRIDINDYRMGLFHLPSADVNSAIIETARLFITRMKQLVLQSNTVFSATVKFPDKVHIIPDEGIHLPLSRRSIPYYYVKTTDWPRFWNPAVMRRGRVPVIPGMVDTVDNKLMWNDINAYTFFRIQGHHGVAAMKIEEDIAAERKKYHLPFDIKIVYLGTPESMQELIKDKSAHFTDLGVMLEDIVYDLRAGWNCANTWEDKIFPGGFNRAQIGQMFENLASYISGQGVGWEKKLCDQLCDEKKRPSCINFMSGLNAVSEEYVRRKSELLNNLLFTHFAKKHPGLEHTGGVPKGGTLVLVCDQNIKDTVASSEMMDIVKLVASQDDQERATGQEKAAALLDYKVVADFCLPYTCCSKVPAIQVVFEQLVPQAYFKMEAIRISEPSDAKAGTSYQLELDNQSLYATAFHWELYDYNGVLLEEKDTTLVSEQVTFPISLSQGVTYKVKLTASKESLNSTYEQTIDICPQGIGHMLTSSGEDTAEWKWKEGDLELPLERLVLGGVFHLYKETTAGITKIPADQYHISWDEGLLTGKLQVKKPEIGNYNLEYSFPDITDCTAKATLTVTVVVDTAIMDTRIKRYRDVVKEAAGSSTEPWFVETKKFLDKKGSDTVLTTDYTTLLKVLTPTTPPKKQKAAAATSPLELLLYNATAYYIDQLLTSVPGEIFPAAKKPLADAAVMMKGYDKDLVKWNAVWTTVEITRPDNEATIAAYNDIFKP
ncbi:hypothetical protein [Chitinophaga nivalis]|uniref:PKD domain-containing protein n=1 Tax=Chitinophaga nivalis TaxID=2991709 RepID=A0ABT3IP35_9BACT|nr:hypothetical protein [Chitinophaga nivalis]MCW3464575.1 hypothetical protein [Chitinophaga nivalis]MCW3485734.1 hypothetical protein [Chitinophaga nivalis]